MKFKIDQNLPLEFENILEAGAHDAISVFREGLNGASDEKIVSICHEEGRALITADLDLLDIRAYPPQKSAGYIVFRLKEQTRSAILRTPIISSSSDARSLAGSRMGLSELLEHKEIEQCRHKLIRSFSRH